MLISLDGLGGTRLNELLRQGKLDSGGFAAFAARGLLAGRAVTVTPSLTPTAHASAVTGAPPSRTGIVAHYFREPGTAFGRAADGFAAAFETETLWEAATRQGKRVGVVLYPGADAGNARRRGAFGMVWPEKPARASVFASIPPQDWTEARTSARTFSPARQARLTVSLPDSASLALRLVAVDTTDDGLTDYDLVQVSREGDTAGAALGTLGRSGWFELPVDHEGRRFTAWCRLTEFDPALKRVTLYIGAFYALSAYPDDYRAHVEAGVGVWPGPPDAALLREGHRPEDEDAYEEQAARLAGFLTKALVLTLRTERWDLLVAYQPMVDEIEHAFEPGPDGGSRERVERAIAAMDRSVAALSAALGPRDSLFIHSDHGMVPLTRAVNLEKFLEQKGWSIAREKVSPPPGARRVQVGASSGIAHLYVDPGLSGRERDEAERALLDDARSLSRLPESVVDEVLARKDLARIELDNPRSGDVVVLLKPGFEFTRHGSDVIGPPRQRGGHGYRNAKPELDACFLALGPGISPSRPATVSLLDVAPLVARSLGIEPPRRRSASLE